MKFRYVILSLLCVMTLSFYFVYKKTTSSIKPTLTIGTAAGYAPWVSINQQGVYEGFDIDVMNALAEQLNETLVVKDLGSMSSLFIALEQGKIDALIWGMSVTQDRLKKVAMVPYQGETITSYPLLFWNEIPEGIKSIQDMRDNVVCVEPASSQDTVLSKYPFVKKLSTEKVDDALLNIQYNKADAALVEPAIAKKFKSKYPQLCTIDVQLDPEDQVNGVGICIKKDNAALIYKIEQAINALRASGVIEKFETKWGLS